MNRKEAETLISLPLEDLIVLAGRTRSEKAGSSIELCGIVNAKSGACSEDCRFCAQSSHYRVDIPGYPLKTADELLQCAIEAEKNGAVRFGIVTSGNCLSSDEMKTICKSVKMITEQTGISVCASLGALGEEEFKSLKSAGLTRYHHNIETSERFYPQIVSTHRYEQRVNTIVRAKAAGLEVCSGFILGLGETWSDRLDMAFLLKDLDVDAVPVNILIPVKGTPMEGNETIDPFDAIRAIALFRVIMGGKGIKVIAGRETVLKDFGALMFLAGANGMMVGDYLTTAGRAVSEDLQLVREVKSLWARV